MEVIYGDQNRSSFSNLSKLKSDEGGSTNGINVYSPARAEEQLRRAAPTNGTLGRMKAASEVEGKIFSEIVVKIGFIQVLDPNVKDTAERILYNKGELDCIFMQEVLRMHIQCNGFEHTSSVCHYRGLFDYLR